MTTIEAVMKEVLTATEDRRQLALKLLRGGEMEPAAARPVTTGPLLLGTCAAAKLLGVSRATMWRMISSGRIEKVELLPGSYWLRRTDLEAMGVGKAGMKAGMRDVPKLGLKAET